MELLCTDSEYAGAAVVLGEATIKPLIEPGLAKILLHHVCNNG